MKQLLVIAFLSIFTISCSDFGKLKIISSLPSNLHEISGIEKLPNEDLLWAISDSKNEAVVYGYDPRKKDVTKVINIANGANVDWEDIATDPQGNLYVGDFGNNNNKRKDLTIYAIPSDSKKVEAIVTNFTLEDQTDFPPKKKNRNFDIEAFIYTKGYFYLFSRNRSKDFDGTVKLYKLPAEAGNQIAKLIDTYKTCDKRSKCAITGAALDHNSGRIALLSHDKVWLLSAYSGDDFFGGNIRKIELDHSSQKESICFKDKGTLYIADEQNGIEGGNLYTLKINTSD